MKSSTREISSGVLTVKVTVNPAGQLTSVKLPKRLPDGLSLADYASVLTQLEAYPLVIEGTPFLKEVWQHMAKIPWGNALTYQELAAQAGSPKASRAVGQACARNPLPLIVPCHRVLASEGPGGFAYGPEWKSALLAFETESRPA